MPRIHSLPIDLLQQLIDHIAASPNSGVSVVATLALLTQHETKDLGLNLHLKLQDDYSMPELKRLTPFFGSSLAEIQGAKSRFDDEFLSILSQSTVARTLRVLHIAETYITDASADVWRRFEALEDIDISSCQYITFKTLDAVSLIPSVRNLLAPLPSFRLSVDQFDAILATDRLTLISTLSLSGYDIFVRPENRERLMEILGRHPTLRSIDIGISSDETFFELEIHKILPNMIDMVTMPSLQFDSKMCKDLLPSFCNFETLFVPENICEIKTNEDLLELARYCTRLETLYLQSYAAEIPSDFSVLSRLTKLKIEVAEPGIIEHWPSSLVDLCVENADGLDKNSMPKFVESICRNLTSLAHLTISGITDMPEKCLPMIVTSLTRLRTLRILQNGSVPIEDTPELCNFPYLSFVSLPGISSHINASTMYLPSVNSTPYFGDIPWQLSRVDQLPNLTSVYLNSKMSMDDRDAVERFLDRFSGQIRSLSDLRAALVTPKMCHKFIHIQKLRLNSSILDLDAAELLRRLPKLRYVQISISSQLTLSNFDWIAHKTIIELDLHFLGGDKPTQIAPLLKFCGGSSSLPSLRRLYLGMSYLPAPKIVVSDLPYLQSFQINSMVQPLDFVLENCPMLGSASFPNVQFNSLRITGVDFLYSITAGKCVLPSSSDQIHLNAPRLTLLRFSDARGVRKVDQETYFRSLNQCVQ